MSKPQEIGIVIIGAGPSGLAAANYIMHEGLRFLVLESGTSIEERIVSSSEQLINGVGGAGLFSDGKLSFFPSGHALWNLQSTHVLRSAFNWLCNLISDFFPDIPSFPDILSMQNEIDHTNRYVQKSYKSFTLNKKQREELLHRLVYPISHRIKLKNNVVRIKRVDSQKLLIVCNSDGIETEIISRQAIFCGGRLGTLSLFDMCPNLDKRFCRFEFGVRIEQPADQFFLNDIPETDPKLIFNDETLDIQWRTFCCCRHGTVLHSNWQNSYLLSGTSDESTSFSNIGFNCRILDKQLYEDLRDEINQLLNGNVHTFTIALDTFLSKNSPPLYSPRLDSLLRKGIEVIVKQFCIKKATLHGPVLEGVGYYPVLNAKLATSLPSLYVAGDSTGLFRGLLPSLMSGYYSACLASREMYNCNVKLNISSTESMSLVFTAQSKKFFYCRDAICEFVLKQKKLPLNPFRIFDYFLNDRVDRDIIRQGNNYLIRICDEFWVFGPVADGVLFELTYAAKIQKKVKFFTVETIASKIKEITVGEIVFEPEVHASRQKRETLLNELSILLNAPLMEEKRQRSLFD